MLTRSQILMTRPVLVAELAAWWNSFRCAPPSTADILELGCLYQCAQVALQNSPLGPYAFVTVLIAEAVFE